MVGARGTVPKHLVHLWDALQLNRTRLHDSGIAAIRGSLRKFLDAHQLSTIIEILPLRFLKVLSLSIYAIRIHLNQDSKHWSQSLSLVHRAPLGMLQPRLQVLKTASHAVRS